MSTEVKEKEKRCDVSKLKVGDRLSEIQYYEVTHIRGTHVGVKNERGFEFSIADSIIEEGMYSAEQFTETKQVTKTELAVLLESAKDTIFTASFNKLPDEKSVMKNLQTLSIGDLTNEKAMKKLSKEIVKGEERIIIGYLVSVENNLGRSHVVDLAIPADQHRLRQIDHRTINWIIYKNVKYVLK